MDRPVSGAEKKEKHEEKPAEKKVLRPADNDKELEQ